MSYLFNNIVKQSNLDGFGRTRVSEPFTISDYTHIYSDDDNFNIIATGSGTQSFVVNKAARQLTVGTSSGSIIYQSRMYHHYSPGKSHLIYISFLFGSNDGNKREIGYYDDNNGIFLRQSTDGTLSFIERRFVSGSASETSYPQSSWNVDKCDGTGSSGFNIDITKTQLLAIDFQWLGVGRIRCGFVYNGEFILAHNIFHSNNLNTVYWSNPSLPVRAEIENTGASPSSAGSMDFICSSIMSEGGYVEGTDDFAISVTQSQSISVLNGSTASIAIRLKNTYNGFDNRGTVFLNKFNVFAENNNLEYQVYRINDSSRITASTWSSANIHSVVEYADDISDFTLDNDDLIDVGYSSVGSKQGSSGQFTEALGSISKKGFLTQNYYSNNSTAFLIVIIALSVDGGSCNFRSSISWKELK